MSGFVGGQLHRVRLVKAVDLQQQCCISDTGPVLMQVGDAVERLRSSEENQPVKRVV